MKILSAILLKTNQKKGRERFIQELKLKLCDPRHSWSCTLYQCTEGNSLYKKTSQKKRSKNLHKKDQGDVADLTNTNKPKDSTILTYFLEPFPNSDLEGWSLFA